MAAYTRRSNVRKIMELGTMRTVWLLLLICSAAAAQDFKSATILATSTYDRQSSSFNIGGFGVGGPSKEMNSVTVILDGYDITAEFPSTTVQSPHASDVHVGSDILVALQRTKLFMKWPNGDVVSAKVVVRRKHQAPRERQARD
ncbi:MAG TPA: hypothetical protein VFO94_02500 [Gammaproteobacteria bacterium]|nr:hypothetical protein [Gammaproteobacteria bacterium]